MSAVDVAAAIAPRAIPDTRAPILSQRRAAAAAFRGFVVRDLTVLNNNLLRFLPSAIVQPTLLVFVFTYLFPAIGQGIGGASGVTTFSTLLLPGIVANSIILRRTSQLDLPRQRRSQGRGRVRPQHDLLR